VALKLSRPEVGSSRRINEGSVINSYAIASLFLSPPERPLYSIEPTLVFLQLSKPRFSIISFTFSSCYSFVKWASLSLAPKVIDSLTVKCSKRMSSCMTYAAYLAKVAWSTSLSLNLTLPVRVAPSLSETRWLKTFNNEVFPAPEAPIITVV